MIKLQSLFRRRRPFNLSDQRAEPWLRRAEDAVSLVDLIPDLAQPFRAVDLGAGDKKLSRILTGKYKIEYTGYDKFPQSDDIVVWNADLGLPPDLGDVTFALGLIEYLAAPRSLFQEAVSTGRYLIFSYVTSDSGLYSANRLEQLGWKTHHSISEIENMVTSAGLKIIKRRDNADDNYSLWLVSSVSSLSHS
ncbi:MAG: hypothetical protein HY245_08725 [Rhizobiales bacterium]|nr:hypothetical protein [Hyphomicrobiales bacterium]MBI3673487.1 hypothetical protein [Hyphomicrobiales bacterium]